MLADLDVTLLRHKKLYLIFILLVVKNQLHVFVLEAKRVYMI